MRSKYHYYYITFILKIIKYPLTLALILNLLILVISQNIALCTTHTNNIILNSYYNPDGSYTVQTVDAIKYTVYPKRLIDSLGGGSHIIFPEPIEFVEVISGDIYIYHTIQNPCTCCIDANLQNKSIFVPSTVDPFSVIKNTYSNSFPAIANLKDPDNAIRTLQKDILGDYFLHSTYVNATYIGDSYVSIAKHEALMVNVDYQRLKLALFYLIKNDLNKGAWLCLNEETLKDTSRLHIHLVQYICTLIEKTSIVDLNRTKYLSHLGATIVGLNNASACGMPEGSFIFNSQFYDTIYNQFFELRRK